MSQRMSQHNNGQRSPLARARGLGPAHGGTHHWLAQRITAIVLAPLVFWFAFSLARLGAAGHATAAAWFRSPVNAVLALLLIVALFHHMQLGLQVVIEDYIHSAGRKFAALLAVRLATAILGIAAALSVLRLALAL